jgi:hypothetical protein
MRITTTTIVLAFFVMLPALGRSEPPPSPLEQYRKLEFPARPENFDRGWKERVALEYEVINTEDLKALRAALKDGDPFVRSMAARALGIREDKGSADALAELARTDPEYFVRIRAVETLGLLKMRAEALELAMKDKHDAVRWVANLAARQAKTETNDAALVRQAYAPGIKREAMGSAKVGAAAPDFTAQTLEGKPFKLSAVLGKKPIAIYFAAFDG